MLASIAFEVFSNNDKLKYRTQRNTNFSLKTNNNIMKKFRLGYYIRGSDL